MEENNKATASTDPAAPTKTLVEAEKKADAKKTKAKATKTSKKK